MSHSVLPFLNSVTLILPASCVWPQKCVYCFFSGCLLHSIWCVPLLERARNCSIFVSLFFLTSSVMCDSDKTSKFYWLLNISGQRWIISDTSNASCHKRTCWLKGDPFEASSVCWGQGNENLAPNQSRNSIS